MKEIWEGAGLAALQGLDFENQGLLVPQRLDDGM